MERDLHRFLDDLDEPSRDYVLDRMSRCERCSEPLAGTIDDIVLDHDRIAISAVVLSRKRKCECGGAQYGLFLYRIKPREIPRKPTIEDAYGNGWIHPTRAHMRNLEAWKSHVDWLKIELEVVK